MLPMLEDILYPNEKEVLSEKYRMALDKIGGSIRFGNLEIKFLFSLPTLNIS